MKTTIDIQTLVGFFSATGLPVLFNAVIKFFHPTIYTLACGVGYSDAAPVCFAAQKTEAVVVLILSALAVGYGLWTLWKSQQANPSPPPGSVSAMIPIGQVPVTVNRDETVGLASAKALPGTTGEIIPLPSPEKSPT